MPRRSCGRGSEVIHTGHSQTWPTLDPSLRPLNTLAYICTSTGYQVPALAAFKGTGWMDVARCTKVRFDRPRWSLSSPSAFA